MVISEMKVARRRLLAADIYNRTRGYGTGTESIECELYVRGGGPPLSPQ
jgi:hypothetical protein